MTSDSSRTPASASPDAEAVRLAVLRVPGVVGLHGGRFGEVGTYLPGRRITGIRIRHDAVEVHIVAAETADVRGVATAVHAAVQGVTELSVHVVVADLGPAVGPS